MSTALSKYYKLFGLPETATQAEIKRKYRQLAMRYHPDKNGGDDRLFLEIKEAYEYLSGQKTVTQQQTHTYSPTRSTSQARQQSNEERIKQAQQRKKDTAYKEHIENERYFQKLTSGPRWRVLKLVSKIGAILFFVLIVDLFLPKRYTPKRIIAYDKQNIGGLDSDAGVKKVFFDSGETYYVENFYSIYSADPDVILVKSAIFHNEIGFIPTYGSDTTIYRIQYSIGAHVYILSPLFLLPLCIVLFKRKTYTFTLFYFLSLFISTPLILLFLFSGNRWLHLITFGYL